MTIFTPYLVIGVLTGFKANKASPCQATTVMLWLVAGQVHGYFTTDVEKITQNRTILALLTIFILYAAYSLQGFVTVGQELLESGICPAV
jgi:hypothetical protein